MPEMIGRIESVRPELPERPAVPLTQLLRRVESEYREMPGLRLTLPQAQRLFALREDVCARVLTTLADQTILRRDAKGAYVLNGHCP